MSDITEIREALVVRPGDTPIVRYAANITMEQATAIKALLLGKFPDLADVLVMMADEIAVYRP